MSTDPRFPDEYRIEGREKVTGSALYAGDVHLPGMLWLAYVRSVVPHARIVAVDTEAARVSDGVHAVLTGADVRPARIGRTLQDWPVLAWDRVRFIGDRIAAVAADTPEAAVRAAARIEVEYEELPTVFDPAEALAADVPILHPEPADYLYLAGQRDPRSHPNVQGQSLLAIGDADIDQVFAGAAWVFEHEFTTMRQHQAYLEPHAAVAWFDGPTLHVITTNKGPFMLRAQLAGSLAMPEETIEVENRFIGGDFGGKGLSLDEYACAFMARATGRPVMAIMSYADELRAAAPRHATRFRLRSALDADGRFLAHTADVLVDGGAYAAGKPGHVLAPMGVLETLGPYRVPNARLQVTAVYTNSVPGGNMRAPGEYQAIFAGESHLDLIAEGIGLDPLELRHRNALEDGDRSMLGAPAHQPRVRDVIEALRSVVVTRDRGPNHGVGYALGIRGPAPGRSTVALEANPDGGVDIRTGVPDQGGGTHTAISRVAAAALGIDASRIRVRLASTGSELVDTGVSGSRVTYHTSRATELAVQQLVDRLRPSAAARLGVPVDAVTYEDGLFCGPALGGSRPPLPFDAVVRDAAPVEVVATFDGADDERSSSMDSVAGYAVEVEVDPDTGAVLLRQVTLVADVGAIINPVAHRGQLTGAFVQALGGALFESLPVVDGQVGAVGLHEYKLPTAADLPPFDTILLPSPPGPGAFGAKMAGELSNGPLAPAIANAVANAVGVRVHALPISAEHVYGLLRERDPRG